MYGTGSAVHGVGAGSKNAKVWHYASGILVFFSIMWIAGAVCLGVFADQQVVCS